MSSNAAVEIPCPDVAGEVDHFLGLGWHIVDVFPADDPQRVTIEGHGLRLIVVRDQARSSRVIVPAESSRTSISPNGTEIVFGIVDPVVPPLVSSKVVSRASGPDAWHVGRAGMHYRDLVPDRQGGAVIASHIRIPTGGPVPDYPHFHEVRFQLIFCQRGWVRLAYESQGEPFVLHAGECVIQPPRIRHRVLESSDDLHVVEVGYPAEHLTIADHQFDFAAREFDLERSWDGQRFVRFRIDDRAWVTTEGGAVECDSGIARATLELADVRLCLVTSTESWSAEPTPDGRFLMLFVLEGSAQVAVDGTMDHLEESDAIVIPVGSAARTIGDPMATFLVVSIDTSDPPSTGH